MIRMGGNVGGVVNFLHQGMHCGHFDMCWKSRGAISLFARQPFLISFRRGIRHCMTLVGGGLIQRSIQANVFMSPWRCSRNLLLGIYWRSVESWWVVQPYPLHLKVLFHLHQQGWALQPLSEEASRIHLPSLPIEQCQRWIWTFGNQIMPPLKWQLPTSFIARISQIQLLSFQDLYG